MAYTDILYEVKNQIAWLTINRPDKGNTFRRQTVLELITALNEARNDAAVRVVVLTGAGKIGRASCRERVYGPV